MGLDERMTPPSGFLFTQGSNGKKRLKTLVNEPDPGLNVQVLSHMRA